MSLTVCTPCLPPDKYRKARSISNELCEVISEVPMRLFDERMEVLTATLHAWKANRHVSVVINDLLHDSVSVDKPVLNEHSVSVDAHGSAVDEFMYQLQSPSTSAALRDNSTVNSPVAADDAVSLRVTIH